MSPVRRAQYRSASSEPVEVMSVADNEQSAECLLMAVYLSLRLQPWQPDGTREATVVRCGRVEIRLRETECRELPLWLEVKVPGQRSIDGAGFEDVVDGVPHLLCFLRAAQKAAGPT